LDSEALMYKKLPYITHLGIYQNRRLPTNFAEEPTLKTWTLSFPEL